MTYPNGHEGGRMYKLNTIRAAVCGLIPILAFQFKRAKQQIYRYSFV